jgi:nucleoid DNA-binding protein
MNLTERKFEELVAEQTNQTVETVEFYTEAMEAVLRRTFEQGFTVRFRGLGTFRVVRLKGGERKLPNGTIVVAEPRRTIRFRAAKKVEDKLNAEKTPEDFLEIKEFADMTL